MALFDLLGRNWALGVIWQLSAGSLTFRELQARCEGVSPTVLNKRLKELKECALVGHDGTGYALTVLGQELFTMLAPFGSWSESWSHTVFGSPDPQETEGSTLPEKAKRQ